MKIFGWIVGILVVIVVMFNISKKMLCSPDEKVKNVAFPLATVIIKYIEKNGVPESLKDIKEIPYELEDCKKTNYRGGGGHDMEIEESENCDFYANDKTYQIKVVNAYDDKNTYKVVDIDIKQYKTTYVYELRYDVKKRRWEHENFPRANVYYDYDHKICSPKFFRFLTTD